MNLVFLYNRRFYKAALVRAFRDHVITTEPVSRCDVLVRWGNINGNDDSAGLVLNRKQPLKNCLDKGKIFEILKLNKIRRPRLIIPKPDSRYPLIAKHFDSITGVYKDVLVHTFSEAQKSKADFFIEHINITKKYNIYFFDLKAFYMTKKVAVKSNTRQKQKMPLWVYEEIPWDLDQDSQKTYLLAQRAIHSLRLDFGVIHAGIDVNGHPVILDISPVPALPLRVANLFHVHVMNFVNCCHPQAELQLVHTGASTDKPDVLLGTDPEFVLRDTLTGRIIYPSDFFGKEGSLGYDQRSENREGRFFPLAEIRPEPDFCPVRLTEKIREILAQAVSIIPPHIEWLAGSLHFERYQIGGHIHFSNLELNSRLLRALDNYLAIPIMLIEDPATSARRRRHYGFLGSIRIKPHGGFEYRTPGSWLVSPELTLSCLCLAKIVATEYPLLLKDYFVEPQMQKAFYQSKKHYFYDIFDDLWRDIMNTSLYSKYSRHLTPLTDLIQNRSHWTENVDLRKSWGLLPSGLT